MNDHGQADSTGGKIIRGIIAVVVVVVFLGVVAYSYWPDILLGFRQLENRIRGVGAETVESQYFEVRNNSAASSNQIGGMLRVLDADYLLISQFLKKDMDHRIPVLVNNGSGPGMMDGESLTVNYDQGVIDLSTAPFFLVFFLEGSSFTPEMNLFLATGFAIYVTEETGLSGEFLRQPSDDWTVLFKKAGVLIPLQEAMETQFTQANDAESAARLLMALAQSGSLMRWVVDQYGMEAARELVSSADLRNVTGKGVEEVEQAWLTALDQKEISPKDCQVIVPRGSFLSVICRNLDEATP